MIRQSLCIGMYGDVPFDELCSQVREIGYAAVEIWGREMLDDYVTTIETAHSHDLVVASMCGHGSIAEGLNKRENHDRIESELRESIDIAASYRIPGLICFSGNRVPGQSDEEGMVICSKGLKRIAPYAEEKGINLNIELLNSRVDHSAYLADHCDWGVALCEMVGSSRVKLLYDIYHMQIMEGDIIRRIRQNIKHIGHFHTAGNPGRQDMDNAQELNYRGICNAISATGYGLFVGHEFSPKGGSIEALKHAYEICNV